MHGDGNGGNGGEGERITSDAALAFWGSTADLAWAKWRRSLAEMKAGLDAWRADSDAWGEALEKRKAEVDAKVADAERRQPSVRRRSRLPRPSLNGPCMSCAAG